MNTRKNEHGQPVGLALPGWQGATPPGHTSLTGRYCRIEPLSQDHRNDLWDAFSRDETGEIWTYHVIGPFHSAEEIGNWIDSAKGRDDWPYFAIVDAQTGKAQGIASYMRIKPEHGVIEVGGIAYAPALQRSRTASEAQYLLMRHVFDDLGYRRYEWKCDALNLPSRAAALRYGFTYDGLFEQVVVYKGRNRDTTWYSVIDRDWPALRAAYEIWLNPGNFDKNGQQKERLSDLTAKVRSGR